MALNLQVGRTLLSTEQMRGGGKGRCVELLHAFGDMLWGLSPTKAAPNDGFSLDGVLPLAADGDDAADASSAEGAAAQDGMARGAGARHYALLSRYQGVVVCI